MGYNVCSKDIKCTFTFANKPELKKTVMNRSLLIAVFGSAFAIILAVSFTNHEQEGNSSVLKESTTDLESEFEDTFR